VRLLLKEVMQKENISYRQLEITTGINKAVLHHFASGKRFPRIDTLELIAKNLRVGVEDLYESDYKTKKAFTHSKRN
jgi:transcriptional regulator with XRE-family HTH domain